MAPGKARSQLVVKGVVKARNVSVKTCPEVKLSFSICAFLRDFYPLPPFLSHLSVAK